ncbi:MAG: radical SAM protein [Syntrophomonadaceae bacterium]|jgi:pyruvate-formate lyase-activating enzyme|nr:radical SAM protein [Syntrophomonadaceae bacterium]
MYLTLFADECGQVREHPQLKMLGQIGSTWVEPEPGEMIPLPKGASLVLVPGHHPVGMQGDQPETVKPTNSNKQPYAVAALLPQGFTRTLLPAAASRDNKDIPLLGYSAVGLKNEKIYVAAVQTDEHRKWHPKNYNTERLPAKIAVFLKKYPGNRIVRQLANCALEYSCYTAQNLFYGRWEAGIPTTQTCNADCIGCISESHTGADSAQNRLRFSPSIDEIIELGIVHLTAAREAIISFGQGCEGEPALNADKLEIAIKEIRKQTAAGTININTNAGYTRGICQLCDAGLDSIRVTMFSPTERDYNYYHRPRDYNLTDVLKSIQYAKDRGVKVSLNLLTFPGFTDRPDQLEALLNLVSENHIDMIQLRNLNIDPKYMKALNNDFQPLGIPQFLKVLKQEAPQVIIGSYSRPVR